MSHVLNTEAEREQALKNNPPREHQQKQSYSFLFTLFQRMASCEMNGKQDEDMKKVVTLLYLADQHSLKFIMPLF